MIFRLADGKTAEYVCCFDGLKAIEKAIKAANLPAEIASSAVNATVYEVTDKQLRDLGFAVENGKF